MPDVRYESFPKFSSKNLIVFRSITFNLTSNSYTISWRRKKKLQFLHRYHELQSYRLLGLFIMIREDTSSRMIEPSSNSQGSSKSSSIAIEIFSRVDSDRPSVRHFRSMTSPERRSLSTTRTSHSKNRNTQSRIASARISTMKHR